MDGNNPGIISQKNKIIKKLTFKFILIIGFFVLVLYLFLLAPFKSTDTIIHISEGQSVSSITEELKEKNAIRSEIAFKVFIRLLKSGKGIIAGDYKIEKNTPIWTVAWQVSRGHHNLEPVKV